MYMKVMKFKLHRRELQSDLKDITNYTKMKSRYQERLEYKTLKDFKRNQQGHSMHFTKKLNFL